MATLGPPAYQAGKRTPWDGCRTQLSGPEIGRPRWCGEMVVGQVGRWPYCAIHAGVAEEVREARRIPRGMKRGG